MNKQKNQLLILIAVIMVGILYAYIQYLFIPQWSILVEKSAQVSDRKAYLTRLEESYQGFSVLKEQAVDLKAQVSTLDSKIPKKLDKPDIMVTIYNMAKKNAVIPQSLSYEPVKDEGGYLTMGMNFSCVGSPENIYTLVQQFQEGNPYIFVLDSIQFGEGGGPTQTNMRIVAYVYQ